jgi:hypothetical protein
MGYLFVLMQQSRLPKNPAFYARVDTQEKKLTSKLNYRPIFEGKVLHHGGTCKLVPGMV